MPDCFCLLLACLLAGFSTDKDVVLFSNQPQAPVRPAENIVPPPEKLDREDLLKIDRVVFGCLLQRHFWDDGEYSAVFLRGDSEEVAALIKKFLNHKPPVKSGDRLESLPNRTPIDKDTGRPAMV